MFRWAGRGGARAQDAWVSGGGGAAGARVDALPASLPAPLTPARLRPGLANHTCSATIMENIRIGNPNAPMSQARATPGRGHGGCRGHGRTRHATAAAAACCWQQRPGCCAVRPLHLADGPPAMLLQVVEAARIANALGFIEALPEGCATTPGRLRCWGAITEHVCMQLRLLLFFSCSPNPASHVLHCRANLRDLPAGMTRAWARAACSSAAGRSSASPSRARCCATRGYARTRGGWAAGGQATGQDGQRLQQ